MATLCSFSQKSITGTVTDDKGMPLPGVTVKEQNTSNGAVTDFDGNFNLTITQTDAVLIFSFVGFETQEVPVGNQTNITVSLKENLESLSEVVVIGYGTQKRADVTSAVASVKSDEFIEKLPNKYDTMIGENGIRLSGGEKQRLSIARAMLKKSPIILLDEATSSLDAETENKIQKAITLLTKNRTTIVIAHRLSTILNSNKIYVIDKGQVVGEGKHEELLANLEIYKNFYNKQVNKA